MTSVETMWRPPVKRGMQVLDKGFFSKSIKLAAAWIEPPSIIKQFIQRCAHDVLFVPHVKPVVADGQRKLILLRPEIEAGNPNSLHPLTAEFIAERGIMIEPYTMHLTYGFWKADDILRAVLPEHLLDDIPSGFTQVGHIAHLNLREDYLPYKFLIGQVILDKNTSCRTVVNKTDTIDATFRNFQMEVLAGDNDLVAEHIESGCRFRFDFSKVYWNSRLHTEHERLVKKFGAGEAVCDLFAGVGPFAIPAAKRGALVFANDLNPASYHSLKENRDINHVTSFIRCYNMDAANFITTSLQDLQQVKKEGPIQRSYKERNTKKGKVSTQYFDVPHIFSHYIMNLPATAPEYLTHFNGLFRYMDPEDIEDMPQIHVYAFSKAAPESCEDDLVSLCSRYLGHPLHKKDVDIFYVRKVAPNKTMYCITFRLPHRVAFG